MKHLISKFLLVILSGSVTCSLAQSNETDYFEVTFKTQQTLTQLQDGISITGNEGLVDLYDKLEMSSSRLFKVLDDVVETKNIENDYLVTLQNNQVALQKALNQFWRPEFVSKVMVNVSSDYDNKYESINFGISPNFVDKVKVIVETEDDSGYMVYVKYSYDFETDVKRYRFNNPTNNAEKFLSPGYYIIWIEKGDYKSEERIVDIVNSKDQLSTIYFQTK